MEMAGGVCHLPGQWMGQQASISAEIDTHFGLPGLAR